LVRANRTLLKILSLILDGHPLANGTKPADVILPKIEDEIVKANLRKATAIPSRSILFNIDQKFDGIGGRSFRADSGSVRQGLERASRLLRQSRATSPNSSMIWICAEISARSRKRI
jgi:hypothetical protein